MRLHLTERTLVHRRIGMWLMLVFGLSGCLHAQATAVDAGARITQASEQTDLTPAEAADQQNYNQPLRPQFHYTAIQGHIGDATGLIYYKGEFHLFNIFDEWSQKSSAHKRWGHAISTDLVHWRQMPPLLDTIIDHSPGSGSGVVDWNNSSGLRSGSERTLVIFYTDYKAGSCIAYSNDRGRTWIRYKHNPVIAGAEDARDPNVFWYAPVKQWRMIRYEKRGFAFYGSDDLTHWTWLSRVESYYECPDLFELPVINSPGERLWVLIDGDGTYVLGTFNGTNFVAQTTKRHVEYGTALYATQTWKHSLNNDGIYQIAWLRYPPQTRLTWNGQMSFPTRLSLEKRDGEIRLLREPIEQIDTLYTSVDSWKDVVVDSEEKTVPKLNADLADLHIELQADGASEFGLTIQGQKIVYSVAERELQVGSMAVPVDLVGGRLALRILVDRSSLEIFADHGAATFSLITLEKSSDRPVFFSRGGRTRISSLECNHLESIWP
jgi:fructan beta-fructosidase